MELPSMMTVVSDVHTCIYNFCVNSAIVQYSKQILEKYLMHVVHQRIEQSLS